MNVEYTYTSRVAPHGRGVAYLLGALVAVAGVLGACSAQESTGDPAVDDAGDRSTSSVSSSSGAPGSSGGGNPDSGPAGPENVPPAPEYDDIGIQIATTGNDQTGDGSDARPYRTIGHVLEEVAAAGDTLILHPGVYAEAVRIRLPNITIRSHSSGFARIEQAPTLADDGSPTVLFDVDADGGKLQRLEITGGFYAISLWTKWDWGQADTMGATNVTVEDCKIHDSGRDCIKLNPQTDGFVLRRSEIYNSGAGYPAGTSSDDKNAEGIDAVNVDDVLVQDCYIHDTATTGVYLKGGSTHGIIERTRVERTGDMGIALGFDTSLEFFDTAANPEFYENIDGVVRNCVVQGTRYAGIAVYAAKNPKVLNNTIIDTARDGHAPLWYGAPLQDYDPAAGRPPTVNPTVVNNVVSQPSAGVCVGIRHVEELGGIDGLSGPATMSHNLYFAPGAGCTFSDARAGGSGDMALAAWQAHIEGEANSLTSDPQLTADGHLQAGSPAIGAGQTRDDVNFDIDRQPRSAPFDIGADQH